MADDDTIAYGSAAALTELYRKRELSPVEATRAALRTGSTRLQPKLNAFCVVDRDGALAAARASEARWRRGEPLGPLDGVPATIKDLMLMRGFPTLRGSHLVDPRPGLVGRHAGGGAAARGRRGHPRQDHDLGIRLEGVGRQSADRHYPQPVGSLAHHPAAAAPARRRRRGGHRRPASRQRRRRLDPHPVGVLRAFLV